MTISDAINTILAVLAFAGVIVAIWAVLKSDRRARQAYEIERFDRLADLATNMVISASDHQAAILPLWRLSDEQYLEVLEYDRSRMIPGTSTESEMREQSAMVHDTVKALHVILERLIAEEDQVRVAAATLPKQLRLSFADSINHQAHWLVSSTKVAYFSLVTEKGRKSLGDDIRVRIVRELETEYETKSPNSEVFVSEAREAAKSLDPSDSYANAADVMLRFAKHQLIARTLQLAAVFERRHRS